MLDEIFAASQLDDLIQIHKSDLDFRSKASRLRALMRSIFGKVCEGESQFFSSFFAKIVWAIDKYNIEEPLAQSIKQTRNFLYKAVSGKILYPNEKDLFSSMAVLMQCLRFFSGIELPTNVQELLPNTIEFSIFRLGTQPDERIPFLRAVVLSKSWEFELNKGSKKKAILIETEEYGQLPLVIKKPWLDMEKIVWKGATLNLFRIKYFSEEAYLETSTSSLIILEPDYFFDVTDIAECFQHNSFNVYPYFIKLFMRANSSAAITAGNLVNFCLDELIMGNEEDFVKIYDKALKSKPLSAIALALHNKEIIPEIKLKVEKHYQNLLLTIPKLDLENASVEPSFISPEYGLQGRLDVMLEYENEACRKDIIELKSGSSPSTDYALKTQEGTPIQTGVWNNHLAQITCYNLLLDSAFPNRTGSSQILYSNTFNHSLRNSPNIIQKKQEVLNCRNWLMALIRSIAQGNYSIFDSLNPEENGLNTGFIAQHATTFSQAYKDITTIEKIYFHEYISFILKEIQFAKLGNSTESNKGFSALWKDSAQDKLLNKNVITDLLLVTEKSVLQQGHLFFQRNTEIEASTSLRNGDMCILYPAGSEETSYSRRQLLKGTLREISKEGVLVSLRNKMTNYSVFKNAETWTLETDYLDSSNRSLFCSLFEFITCSPEKRQMLLGLSQPRFSDIDFSPNEQLSPLQNDLLKRAITSQDYFLIQGPPGTGKTSYMLKAIAENIYNFSSENILILAYTNRAVDEICSALKKPTLGNDMQSIEFLRLGSKDSSIHHDVLIASIAESASMNELFRRIKHTRVFVSTITSAITNPELFELKKFHTAIIDEATQILEPQVIGVLSKIERFIMIGDEKQLPAVVLQESNMSESEELKSIGIQKLSDSMFERLLKQCTKQGWQQAIGMLTLQKRMHRELCEYINSAFYSGQLTTQEGTWQDELIVEFKPDSSNIFEQTLSHSRMIFIESVAEKESKKNTHEATIVAQIAAIIKKSYGDNFNQTTLGIISPFRLQCSEIKKFLGEDIEPFVTVDTVERFQGSERDIIIISFAMNSEYQLKNTQSFLEINGGIIDRKLNVALTRARKFIILTGEPNVLNAADSTRCLLDYIEQSGGYISLSQYQEQ